MLLMTSSALHLIVSHWKNCLFACTSPTVHDCIYLSTPLWKLTGVKGSSWKTTHLLTSMVQEFRNLQPSWIPLQYICKWTVVVRHLCVSLDIKLQYVNHTPEVCEPYSNMCDVPLPQSPQLNLQPLVFCVWCDVTSCLDMVGNFWATTVLMTVQCAPGAVRPHPTWIPMCVDL